MSGPRFTGGSVEEGNVTKSCEVHAKGSTKLYASAWFFRRFCRDQALEN
jgi:hypothetical protein